MKKKTYITALIVFFSVVVIGCAAMGISAIATTASTDSDKIGKGVFIDSVDVGGMTEEEATKALKEYTSKREDKDLIILVDKKEVRTNLKGIGYTCNENDYIQQALQVGKTGNLIKRYKELKDIEEEKLVYELEFEFDDAKLKKIVEKKCSKFDVKAKNASMKRENGAFVYSEETIGRKVVVDETIEKIKTMVNESKDSNEITVEAIVIDELPQYTKASLMEIDDVIGTFTTTYHDSSTSRATNLANGSKFIDGTVLYPGEVFSCYEHMNPFTAANGYMPAGAYLQGKVVDSIGGGVCQISSTLYNTVLRAELEVVERAPHSMSVGYVKPSADAAIAGTFKDLKFKNNLSDPIYLEGITEGRTITFTIYGNEKRDPKRTIDFVSEVTSTISPPKEVVTEDKTKPADYRRVTQSAHTGSKANLYKVVYMDGVETERILINSSSYAAAPAYVTIGAQEVKEEVEEEPKEPEESEEIVIDDKEKPDKSQKPEIPKKDKVEENPSIEKPAEKEPEDEPEEDVPVSEDESLDDTGEVVE